MTEEDLTFLCKPENADKYAVYCAKCGNLSLPAELEWECPECGDDHLLVVEIKNLIKEIDD